MDSRWTVGGQSVDSRWTVCGQSVDSLWTVCGQPVDSRWTVSGQSVDSRWIVGGQSVDSRWTTGNSRWKVVGQSVVSRWTTSLTVIIIVTSAHSRPFGANARCDKAWGDKARGDKLLYKSYQGGDARLHGFQTWSLLVPIGQAPSKLLNPGCDILNRGRCLFIFAFR